ncbi:MAG: DNA (cytosine-5-)-methyltransferase [Candidatus Thiodiazotropha endolucinida]|nr:DNA (cytosine-5-)-methyltransferase [Candidatus Thiodiazotropha endolucinida]
MRVADLFCGGGGISEGLKQAGFEIVFGLDNSKAATDTFAFNHPNAKVIKDSIENLTLDDIPEFDILVGGPPCVEFSASKQGRGNILAGLKLVQAFLRVVHLRKPKYWIMENVPKIVLHLPEKIPLSWIGIDEQGFLHVPNRCHFNAANFGSPQNRERFLMGHFPVPEETHYNPEDGSLFAFASNLRPWTTLEEVLKSLPSPLKEFRKTKVSDMNYGFSISSADLTDHFHEVELSSEEARRIRKVKEEHPFMGWMPFPDQVNKPARTVVATQLGRETLVIGEKVSGVVRYRRATVRECAVIQGYPITYQIFGSSLSQRYRVIGNGVPPLLTQAIGIGIRKHANLAPLAKQVVITSVEEKSPKIASLAKRKAPNHKITRKFSELIPGKEVRGCRVELTNTGSRMVPAQLKTKNDLHIVEWVAKLTIGEGKKNMKQMVFEITDAVNMISPLFSDGELFDKFLQVAKDIDNKLVPMLPDATTLQGNWTMKTNHGISPEVVVDELSSIINNHFPAIRYSNYFVLTDCYSDILPKKGIRIRLCVALLCTSYICKIINYSTEWASRNQSSRYSLDNWSKRFTKTNSRIEHLSDILNNRKQGLLAS